MLGDPEKRAQYDNFGHAAFEDAGQGGFGGFGFGFEDLGDIFSEFFGGFGPRQSHRPQRGADLRYELTISFEEAAFGTETEITIPRTEVCEHCGGNRAEPGTPIVTCPELPRDRPGDLYAGDPLWPLHQHPDLRTLLWVKVGLLIHPAAFATAAVPSAR